MLYLSKEQIKKRVKFYNFILEKKITVQQILKFSYETNIDLNPFAETLLDLLGKMLKNWKVEMLVNIA